MTQLNINDAPTWNASLAEPAELDPNGYFCWLGEGGPSNAAHYKPGVGATPQEAIRSATYWANQLPWVRVTSWADTPEDVIEWVTEALSYDE